MTECKCNNIDVRYPLSKNASQRQRDLNSDPTSIFLVISILLVTTISKISNGNSAYLVKIKSMDLINI